MRITQLDRAEKPFTNEAGEIIYELMGAAPEHGGAVHHSLAHVIIPPGKSSICHYHRVSEETYIILRGSARIQIDTCEYPLTAGQSCLILPGEKHQIFCKGETALEFLTVCAPAWNESDYYLPE